MIYQASPLSVMPVLLAVVGMALQSCGRPSAVPEVNSKSSTYSEGRVTDELATDELATDEPIADEPIADELVTVAGTPCAEATEQDEINECSSLDYKRAESAQNQAFRARVETLSMPAIEALDASDVAWRDFRDKDCAFESSQYEGGSIAPAVQANCLSDRTYKRAELIKIDQAPSGNELPDSELLDADLNSQYQALLAILNDEEAESIVDVQLAWIEYRDRHCLYESDYLDIPSSQCLARLTQTRSAELKTIFEQRSL